jgi:50S ribosomal subunit-associated GTPase HflX
MGEIPAVLVLNKCDLATQWEIDPDREARLAAEGWRIFRSSAKTGESVEQIFSQLTLAMFSQ